MIKIENYTSNPDYAEANFKKLVNSLIYDEEIEDGFITKEFYYSDVEKTDLVVEVNSSYVTGPDTMVGRIDFEIKYYDQDGNVGRTVNKVKILTDRQKSKLAKKRRATLVDNLEMDALKLMTLAITDKSLEEILQIGAGFILKHDRDLYAYQRVGSKQVIAAFQESDEDWLDVPIEQIGGATIRQFLMGAFS